MRFLKKVWLHYIIAGSEKKEVPEESCFESTRPTSHPPAPVVPRKRPGAPLAEHPTPYHVWVSEIMLQQTRVAAVLDYYRRFMEALPTVADLAAVEEDRLMKLWQGLATTTAPATSRKPPVRWRRTSAGCSPTPMRAFSPCPAWGSTQRGPSLHRLRRPRSGGGRQRAAGGHAADGLPGRYCRSQGKKGRAGTDPGRHAGG